MYIRAQKKRLKKLAYQHYLKEERKKAYEEFLQQKAESIKDEEELRKRDIMQRLKENENNCRFYKQQREKYIKTTQEIRKCYQRQTVSLCFCQYVRIYKDCKEVETKLLA
jgi:hypothetical protein